MTTAATIQHRQRAARDVFQDDRNEVNVGRPERTVSTIGGGALVLLGLSRGGLKGLALAGLGGVVLARGLTGHCSAYGALGVSTAETDPEPGPSTGVRALHGVRTEQAALIRRSPDDIYFYWRDHSNLQRFMSEIESVESPDGVRSHWTMRVPLGITLSWDAEIVNDEPGRLIAWRSLPGSTVDTAGSVRFTPTAKPGETEVRLNQKFDPPGGRAAIALAKVLGSAPDQLAKENLRRLKQLLEAGEVPTITGQPSGRA